MLAKCYLFAERVNRKDNYEKRQDKNCFNSSYRRRKKQTSRNGRRKRDESRAFCQEDDDIKKLSNENDVLREEIKDLKQDIRILTNQNLADKEVLSKFTSQLLEMLEKLDKMKQEKEILSLELSEMKEKKPFWKKIFGR